MEFIFGLLQAAIWVKIIFTVLGLLLIWFFIKSAVKSGTKDAILEAHKQLERDKKNPPPTEEELFEQEMKNWS